MMKVGILGGGQLGRMLLQEAANYPVDTFIMESDKDCPAAHLAQHFVKGDIRAYDDVYQFGKNLDAITIEIENVNVEALMQLKEEGIKVYPDPEVLKTIRSKVLQKKYYSENQIPTAEFAILTTKSEIENWKHLLPAVQKLAEGGYDVRGVQIID